MGAERERISSKPLHNFTLPRSWGNQKQLRCMQSDSKKFTCDYIHDDDQPPQTKRQRRRSPPLNGGGGHSSVPPRVLRILEENDEIDEYEHKRNDLFAVDDGGGEEVEMSETEEEDEGGIKAVREKIMMDLRIEADKMKAAFLRGKQPLQPPPPPPPPPPERPWNLRTRKPPGSKTGNGNFNFNSNKGLSGFGEEKKNKGIFISSPEKEQPEERAKFSSTLTRKEIEEDFMRMVGHRPPRRPKKRPRADQKQMDNLFPGAWLTEVTADDYKVVLPEEIGKK